MKILALDIGDQWIGSALSDALGILASPYKTVTAATLDTFLQELLQKERISTIVVGYPLTLRGTESDQTRKIREQYELLKATYPHVAWVLWDERLTSKQADRLKHAKTKEEKIKAHSVAAAFILETYLQYRAIHMQQDEE